MAPKDDGPRTEAPSPRPVRALIVDDSVVARTVLERILQSNSRFTVARKAHNADEALDYLSRESVDIVLLDVEMPGASGIVALPDILRAGGDAKVVILSSNCEEGSASAVEALALGASDVMSKPGRGAFGDQFSQRLINRLLRIADGGRAKPVSAEATLRLQPIPADQAIRCIAVGASTGGIHALTQLLGGMDRPLGVPILITQHLPPSFIPYFATQLGRATSLPCKVAEEGEPLKPDHIYIAPGHAHLGTRRSPDGRVRVALSNERSLHAGVPAVDPMFNGIADSYGKGALAIILTGMGRDGTVGARKIVSHGGWIIAQDRESSVVWGMPGSVARAGLASALLPPDQIMSLLGQRRIGVAAA